MSRDVVVNISLETPSVSANEMNILILSTEGVKTFKTYTSLQEIAEDYTSVVDEVVVETKAYKKAKALFAQNNPFASGRINKVSMVGIAEPANAEGLVQAIETIRATNDDWYVLLTDLTSDDMIAAIAAWVDTTANTGANNTDKPKLYFAKTSNSALDVSNQRAVIIYCDASKIENEEPDAAWVGYNAPIYPRATNWKFKQPSGVSPVSLSDSAKTALEAAHINFMTTENKRNYMKNGVCSDGTYIDEIVGADYITFLMKDKLYDVFLANDKIPYTDDGFTLIAGAILSALEQAATLGIIAIDPESNSPIYNITIPTFDSSTAEQRATRTMPDINWEAQQQSAVNSAKTNGVLRITL